MRAVIDAFGSQLLRTQRVVRSRTRRQPHRPAIGDGGGHLALARPDLVEQRVVAGQPGGDQPCPRDLAGPVAGLAHQAADELRPHQVDQVVGELAGDDLAAQPVVHRQIPGDRLHRRAREVVEEVVLGGRIVGEVGRQQTVLEVQLGVGEEHRQLRPGERLVRLGARGKLVPRGESLGVAVEEADAAQVAHQRPVAVLAAAGAVLVHRNRLAAGLVVAHDERGDGVGEALQQAVALLSGDQSRVLGLVQEDLEVDLAIGEVDASGIVERVGVDASAARARTPPAPPG